MMKHLKNNLLATVITFCISYSHLSIQASEQKKSSINTLTKTVITSCGLFVSSKTKSLNKPYYNNSLKQIKPFNKKHEIAPENNNNTLKPIDRKDNFNEYSTSSEVQVLYNNLPSSIKRPELNKKNDYSTYAKDEGSIVHSSNNTQSLTPTPQTSQTKITTTLNFLLEDSNSKFFLMKKAIKEQNENILNLIQKQNQRFDKENQEIKKTLNLIQKHIQEIKQMHDKNQKDIKELKKEIEQQKQNNTNSFNSIEKTIQEGFQNIEKHLKANTDNIHTLFQGLNLNTQSIQTINEGQSNNTKYILILAQRQDNNTRPLFETLT